MATVVLDEKFEIPAIANLNEFREWVHAETFPRQGRIDYVRGRIEVDMSPEDLFTHGTLKSQVAGKIEQRVGQLDLGHAFVGETRLSSEAGDLSAEPDVLVLSYQTIDQHRARLVPKASGAPGRFIEVEGAADLVVEIVSDSSLRKDTQHLPAAYFAAGVREFWLIDARGADLVFQIHERGADAFHLVKVGVDDSQPSAVLAASCRLQRKRHARGHCIYQLTLEPA